MSQMAREATKQELEQLSTNWATAELSGDTAFIEQLLADDFVGVGPRGFMLTKGQWLDRFRSGDLSYESFSWDELLTRLYGDAAVVIGRETSKGRYKDQDIQGQYRETRVFVRPGGRWLLASLHLSPIAGPPPGPRRQAI
jgi:ketosteroid isomerase-like protein